MELRERAEESQQLAQEVGQYDSGMMWERESLHCCSSGSTVGMLRACVCACVCTYVCMCMHVCACVMCLSVSTLECEVGKLLWCFILYPEHLLV